MSNLKITKKHHKHLNNPFTSQPKPLPVIQGKLLFNPLTVPSAGIYDVGTDFLLNWSSKDGGSLSLSHRCDQPEKRLWSTIPGQPFVCAAVAETEVEESRGSFLVKDGDVHLACNHQTIDYIGPANSDEDGDQTHAVLISGKIISAAKRRKKKHGTADECCAKYWILIDQKTSHQIGFQVKLGKPNVELHRPKRLSDKVLCKGFSRKLTRRWAGRIIGPRRKVYVKVSSSSLSSQDEIKEDARFNRIWLTYASESSERFFGFGEQFSHMDFKGKKVPIFVQEQGIGRGDQPITFAANLVSYRAGGDSSTTYAPSPFYITSKMRSLYLEGYNYSIFDLTQPDRVRIQIHGHSVQARILHGGSPTELIERFTESIGRPPELPDWIISGAVVGMQGGTETVRSIWKELQAYDVPVSAFWLQDWVGQRETVIGSQLWWNWEVDSDRYAGWRKLIKDLRDERINVMTYCNPCLAPMDAKPNINRNLYEDAKKLDILIKDRDGEPYMVPNTAFDVGMLDFTHPSTATWFKKILLDMVNDGVRGWMADFGEGLPVDAYLHSGEDPVEAHNKYPELWAKINREFVDEWRETHSCKEQEDDLVFFMRAGFRGSPKWAMLFWEGDQMVSWQANDGIKSSVVGLLSGGISGYALNHSDIGGYCSVSFPFIKYRRTEELLLRWMELNAFTTVFRTHEGNKPSSNHQFYTNQNTLSQFARLAKIYKAWKFYRTQLVKEASQKGLPVCRHLFLHYPDDEYVQKFTYEEFLVGSEILVVPVVDKGKGRVKAYFPVGERCLWKHIWTGKLYSQGNEAWIEAPLGNPAVFIKNGSPIGEAFLKNLKDYKIL